MNMRVFKLAIFNGESLPGSFGINNAQLSLYDNGNYTWNVSVESTPQPLADRGTYIEDSGKFVLTQEDGKEFSSGVQVGDVIFLAGHGNTAVGVLVAEF